MAQTTTAAFPRRDSRRRILHLTDLLGVMLAGIVAGVAVLLVFDGVFALLGLGEFGGVNGWLAVILPVMVLVEEFRAWHGVRGRVLCAIGAAVIAVAAGLLVAGLSRQMGDLPGLVGGALGAATAAVGYSLLWYYLIRAAGGRTDEGAVT